MVPPRVGFIVGLFVQAILYGAYIATLIHGIYWHLYEDKGQNISKTNSKRALTIVAIMIFMFSTINVGILLSLVLGRGPAGVLSAITAVIEAVTIHIVDAVLIYRCWVIHGYSWRIACIPLILWCSCLVWMSLDIYYLLMAPEKVKGYRCAFFVCHIATNVYATSATCYNILSVAKKNRTSNYIYKIGRMLAYSGGLLVMTSTMNLIYGLIGFGPNLISFQVTFDAINFSMAGIAFNFILMYVGKQRAKHSYSGWGQSSIKNPKTLPLHTHNATVLYDSSCDSSDYIETP